MFIFVINLTMALRNMALKLVLLRYEKDSIMTPHVKENLIRTSLHTLYQRTMRDLLHHSRAKCDAYQKEADTAALLITKLEDDALLPLDTKLGKFQRLLKRSEQLIMEASIGAQVCLSAESARAQARMQASKETVFKTGYLPRDKWAVMLQIRNE